MSIGTINLYLSDLIDRYSNLSSKMLSAIAEDDNKSVQKLDQDITHVFKEILETSPSSEDEKLVMVEFLIHSLSPKSDDNTLHTAVCKKLGKIISEQASA